MPESLYQGQTEAGLLKNRTSLRDILDSLDDLVLVFNVEETILDCNESFANCLKKEYKELLGSNVRMLRIFSDQTIDMMIGCTSNKQKYAFEDEFFCADKKTFPVTITSKRFHYEDNVAILCTIRDITERKALDEFVRKEKERLENYLDVAGSIISILNKKQKILFVNRKGCEVLGYSKEDMLGKNWFDDFLPERMRIPAEESYELLLKGELEPPEYAEKLMVTKNGEERLIRWHDVALRDKDGDFVGCIISGEDITEQRLMQKRIEDSEHKLNAIFDSINDEIYICNYDRNIISVNNAVVRNLGYNKEEILRMKHDELVIPEMRSSIDECERELFKNKNCIFETMLLRKDGSSFPVEVNARLIDYDGKDAIICVDRDISQRRKAESELRIYAEELKESNELKELFTDIIRHDLLTPASIVKGYSEELLRRELDKDTARILNKIHENNERLIELLNSATRLSKLQKVDEIEFEHHDIVSIFQMVIDRTISETYDLQRNIILNASMECDSKVNPIIEEAFANFLSNAIKYSPAGTNISMDFIDLGDEWKVTVSDEGTGISDHDKKFIFDRFRRADKNGIKGAGLGLAIVKRIVELHGGRCGVEDNPAGKGSVFWLTVEKSH